MLLSIEKQIDKNITLLYILNCNSTLLHLCSTLMHIIVMRSLFIFDNSEALRYTRYLKILNRFQIYFLSISLFYFNNFIREEIWKVFAMPLSCNNGEDQNFCSVAFISCHKQQYSLPILFQRYTPIGKILMQIMTYFVGNGKRKALN